MSLVLYFASFASMSLALILGVQEVSIRRSSSRRRDRLSSRTPLLGRRTIVDEEQGSEASSRDHHGAGNDSIFSLYGTFSDFSHATPAAYETQTAPKTRPLVPWRSHALPSMPESFAATYELIKTFPHISMAPVHLVKHRKTGEQLIIKQLQSRLLVNDQSWPEEAYIQTKDLGAHKNILGIQDVHIASDGIHTPYANVVMKFASRGDLYDIMDKCRHHGKQLPAQFILHFVSSMIDALAFIHHGHVSYDSRTGRPVIVKQPVILHCDIKPDNIFLNMSETSAYGLPDVLLADFGLAGFEDIKGIRGTRAYFPPEILEADRRADEEKSYWREAQRTTFCSKQSDMYSFAATLYELITFRRYCPGDDIEAAFEQSNVSGYIDILFLLQSGLSECASDRELAKSWHYVSFAFKQRLALWCDAGGRLPSWFTDSEIPIDTTAGASRSPQVESEEREPSLSALRQWSSTSSVYSKGISAALALDCDNLTEMLKLLENME